MDAAKLSIRFRKAVVKFVTSRQLRRFGEAAMRKHKLRSKNCWVDGSALRRFGDVVQKVCHVLQQGPAVKAR